MTKTQSRTLWAAALLAGLVLAAYLPALRGGFVFDDDNLVTRNPVVQAPDGLRRIWLTAEPVDYWPVTLTSFWLEWRLWGADTMGYHLVNLALHVADALLVWSILRRLKVPGAYVAALIFAVHPVNVQSVAWIAERKNVLSLLFSLLSVWAFLKCRLAGRNRGLPDPELAKARTSGKPATGPLAFGQSRRPDPDDEASNGPEGPGSAQPDNRWYAVSLAFFVLGMLSKGSVAVLPLVLLGIVAWRRRVGWRDALWAAPYFAVAGGLTLVNIGFQNHGLTAPIRTAGFAERLLEAGAAVWFYLGKALWPARLTFVYPLWRIDAGNLLWWIPLLGAAAATVLLGTKGGWGLEPAGPAGGRRVWRALFFAWLYFIVALMPVLGFVDIYFMKYSLVADHYQYLALIGVAGVAGAALAMGRAPRWAAPAAVAVLAVLAWQQARDYRDAEILYRATLRRNPGCWLADNNLGIVEVGSGRVAQAQAHFEEALRLNPDYPEANYNLGLLLLARPGGAAAAEERFARAVRFNSRYAEAHYYLGNSLRQLGRPGEAVAQYEEAVRCRPNYPEAETNLGVTLAGTGRVGEALPHFEAAVRLDPGSAEAHLNLAYALQAEGRAPEAARQFALAARLDPRLSSHP